MTCVSFLKPSGKSGRQRAIHEAQVRISSSRRRPSRLKKPPGILPAAYVFSTYSQVSGKKSSPGRSSPRHGGDEDDALAVGDEDGAVRLLGEAAGLEGERLAADHDGFTNEMGHGRCAPRRHAACVRLDAEHSVRP